MKTVLIFTCEHAVDSVPKAYKGLFAPHGQLLKTHRAIDFGASKIAHYLAELFQCELIEASATRLLVDCNRSLSNRACFSEITRPLPKAEKENIAERYYLPYRKAVQDLIHNKNKQGNIIWHFSIHSFTPKLDNIVRNADIGILYDPKRSEEKRLAEELRQLIKKHAPKYRVRKNYPYRGSDDGFTPALRKQFSASDYVGIEIECNQALVFNDRDFSQLRDVLGKSLMELFERERGSIL